MESTFKNILDKCKTIENLLVKINDSNLQFKSNFFLKNISQEEKELIKNKIGKLIECEKNGNCVLLARGLKKDILQKRLICKLNSNDSLYDGLFLVGEKAKNFLEKESDIPHPIKIISDTGVDVALWIFDEYEYMKKVSKELEYFKDRSNKRKFAERIKNRTELIDYYLFGLHTFNSDSLVNFVSSTTSPKVAMSHENDFIILFWLPNEYKHLSVSKDKLESMKEKIKKLKLPILKDSFHTEENEYSMKGFILPHFILCALDLNENSIIINPRILQEKDDWVIDGFDVDGMAFREFIKSTKYKRFLTLIDYTVLNEYYVC